MLLSDAISIETSNDHRFTQSQPHSSKQRNEPSMNVPAVAAAVSASIAAMSYDDYGQEPFDTQINPEEQQSTTAQIISNHEYNSSSWKDPVNHDNVPASSQAAFADEPYQYSYEPPNSYLNSVLDDTNLDNDNNDFSIYPPITDAYSPTADPYTQTADNAYMPTSDHYTHSTDLYTHPAAPYSHSEEPHPVAAAEISTPSDVYHVEPNYPYYSDYPESAVQPTTDYHNEYEQSTQSFSSYPSVWDDDASVNPNQTTSFTAYPPVSDLSDNLSSWDDTPATVNLPSNDKSIVYPEPSFTSTTYATSWDDDASEVPRQSYQSKPPWAYQDYPEEKAKPHPVRPPPPIPSSKLKEVKPPVQSSPQEETNPIQSTPKQETKPLVHSFIVEKPKPEESKEWLEYEQMTAKIAAAMKQTQDKLQEINKTSITKEVSSRTGYLDLRSSSPIKQEPAQNLMDMDLIDTAPSPVPETDSKLEWKPIHERLNEEIQKQKELNKPRRPPPPKSAPKRPPPPPSSAKPNPAKTYATSWDDEDTLPPPPPATMNYNQTDYTSAWDNDSVPNTVAPIPNQPNSYNTTPMMPQTSAKDADIDVMAPSYSSKTETIDHSNVARNIDDFGFGALNGMDDSSNSVLMPPPPLDIYQTQSVSPLSLEDELPPPPPPIMTQENIGDEDIFDVSKYSPAISGKPAANAAADLDDFFGGTEKKTLSNLDFEQTFSKAPPKSPLVERSQPQAQPKGKWEDTFDSALPVSDSGFFQKVAMTQNKATNDPFAPQINTQKVDLFAALDDESLMQDSYDPFDVKPIDVIVAEAKSRTQAIAAVQETQEDLDFFGQLNHKNTDESSTPRVPSPTLGFGDEFQPDERDDENRTPSPLFDEDDSLPLQEYPATYTGDGWELMLRYPAKKKIMGERYWKSVFVQISGNTIQLYYSRNDKRPFQELPLQSNYCMSDITLQAYDVYGKIHTVKVQYVLYKERVGVRPGQIPKLVEGKLTKLGLPLEHAAQTTVLLKFGSLNHNDMQSFVYCVEDVLFKIPSARERPCLYKQDEIQVI